MKIFRINCPIHRSSGSCFLLPFNIVYTWSCSATHTHTLALSAHADGNGEIVFLFWLCFDKFALKTKQPLQPNECEHGITEHTSKTMTRHSVDRPEKIIVDGIDQASDDFCYSKIGLLDMTICVASLCAFAHILDVHCPCAVCSVHSAQVQMLRIASRYVGDFLGIARAH